MTDSRKGYVRMRTLQAVVLLIFGVIILRLAYIQLIDPKYEKLARGNALRHVVPMSISGSSARSPTRDSGWWPNRNPSAFSPHGPSTRSSAEASRSR